MSNWMLLRFFLMFVTVALFVIAAVLIGIRDKRRESKHRTAEPAAHARTDLSSQPCASSESFASLRKSAQSPEQDVIYSRAA